MSRTNKATDPISLALDRVRIGLRNRLVGDVVAHLAIGIGVWILASFCIDRGLFAAFRFDLTEQLPGWTRWGQPLLALALAIGFILSRVPLLIKRFSDHDMALALERHFGKELGDSVITAVELSDKAIVERQEMSAALVEVTRQKAISSLSKINIDDVFNSNRPFRLLLTSLGVFLGGYGALLLFFTLAHPASPHGDHAKTTDSPVGALHDNLWFWAERTLMGRDLAWPRNVFLRLAGFPSNGKPLRAGRGTPAQFRVEASRFIVAGAPSAQILADCKEWLAGSSLSSQDQAISLSMLANSAHHGWRPATIFDIAKLGAPAGWKLPEPAAAFLPHPGDIPGGIDSIGSRIPNDPTITLAISTLETLSGSMMNRRQVRALSLPPVVEWLETAIVTREDGRQPKQTIEELTADAREPGTYPRTIPHLTESLDITARAGDFQTSIYRLDVLPAPVLARLDVTEVRPAYLTTHLDADLDGQARSAALAELANRRVMVPAGDRLMPRAEASVIEFPSGSGLVLDFSLQEGRAPGIAPVLEALSGNMPAHTPVEINNDAFKITFEPIREERIVLLRFADSDNIRGERKLIFRPIQDTPPTLEARPVDDLRETESGYLVTSRTRIPFRGSSRDDHGLATLRHVWTTREIDRDGAAGSLASRLAQMLVPDTASRIPAALNLTSTLASLRRTPQAYRLASALPLLAGGNTGSILQFAMPFQQGMMGLSLPRQRSIPAFSARLKALKGNDTLRAYTIEPDSSGNAIASDFPLTVAGIIVDPDGSVARGRRYMVELGVEAEDLDVSMDPPSPHITRAGPFTLVVLPDDEMLELIQSDEMRLRERVVELRNELLPPDLGQRTPVRYLLELKGIASDLREASNRLDARRTQSDQIDRVIDDARRKAEEIERDFRRLTRQTALCGFPVKDEKERVAKALEKIHKESLPSLRGSVEGFRKQQESVETSRVEALKTCRARSAELMAAIDEALNLMGGASDFDSELARLRGILREQENQTRRLDSFRKELVNKLLEDLLNPK